MNAKENYFCPIKSLIMALDVEAKKKKKCCKSYKHSKRCKSCPKD